MTRKLHSAEVEAHIQDFGLDKLIVEVEEEREIAINESVDPNFATPYQPEWDDLVRMHKIVLERRVTTILEFGCGFSTLVLAHAIAINSERHREFVRNNLRRNNPFEIHTVDDIEKFVNLTRDRIPDDLKQFVQIQFAKVDMTVFNGRICTEYRELPNVCPDFIYLDGPSQHSPYGEINGISTRHPDRLPMAADLLKIEHFLLPGTFILVDGRTANARFLASNFQRNWHHHHDVEGDVHTFELREAPLGRYNRKQLEYCLGEEWIRRSQHRETA